MIYCRLNGLGTTVKLGMPITYGDDFAQTVDQLRQFEGAGLERVMIPEAYGFDAVTQMGFVAAGRPPWNWRSGFCRCSVGRRQTWP
jgi:hypothetical protein